MMSTVSGYGRTDGLDYHFETMMFGDTADTHMLVKAVGDTAVKARLVEALYEQGTSHSRSIFDRSSLEVIAREVGVSEESIQLACSSPKLRDEMEEEEAFAAQLGSGVPLFVFDNAFSLSGAQPDAAFFEALNKMPANANIEDSSVPSLGVFHEGRLLRVIAGSRSVSVLKKANIVELEDASQAGSSDSVQPNQLLVSLICRVIFLSLSIDRMGAIVIKEFR